ncbi:hypothetical protein ABW19_dt0210578 [Dactylella cylindrospora]|nr:hypothetical protein ABW19_dt0210578 [Dactylella cylindrospora]
MAHLFAASQSGSLPSYEAATSHNPIPIFAAYVRREDLFNCSLVCRAWHEAFEDEIWGEPAACFGFGEKNPLIASSTRSKVHTLSLEKVTASIYTSLPDIWFSNFLVLLPELRRLLLPTIPFVDHNSLLSKPTIKGDLPHYNLYHLNISNLTNTTSKSLVALFTNLTPGLAVLDLSRTNSAGHPDVLRTIGSQLRNLKSLKLKWLKLTNDQIRILARGVQVRLERLDLTGNILTDDIARDLLDWCFMPPEFEEVFNGSNQQVPAAHESDDDSDAEFGDEEEWMTAKKLERRELRRKDSALPDINGNIPSLATKGLTHLHISNNRISSYEIIESEAPDIGFFDITDPAGEEDTSNFFDLSKDDFSFFEDETFKEGAGNWREMPGSSRGNSRVNKIGNNKYGEEVSTLDVVREWRRKSKEEGRSWKGNIKVMRDIGGAEVSERGVEGNRWGFVSGSV